MSPRFYLILCSTQPRMKFNANNCWHLNTTFIDIVNATAGKTHTHTHTHAHTHTHTHKKKHVLFQYFTFYEQLKSCSAERSLNRGVRYRVRGCKNLSHTFYRLILELATTAVEEGKMTPRASIPNERYPLFLRIEFRVILEHTFS